MSLDASDILARLAGAGAELANDKAPEALDDLLARGSELADTHLNGELAELREPALAALAELAKPEVKQAALRLGSMGLAWVVGFLADGEDREAHRRYIETEATFEERLAFQAASGDKAEALGREREESWDVLKDGLGKAGKVGLKALGFLMLGALGL